MRRLVPLLLAVTSCHGADVVSAVDGGPPDAPPLAADGARLDPSFTPPDAAPATSLDGSSADPGPTCAEESATAMRQPLDLLFLLDRSSSMLGLKWDLARRGLEAFAADPRSTGLGVGLQVFPGLTGALPTTAECTSDADCGFGSAGNLYCQAPHSCVDDAGKVLSANRCSTRLFDAYPLCSAGTCLEIGHCPGSGADCGLGRTCADGQACLAGAKTCTVRAEGPNPSVCSAAAYETLVVPVAPLPAGQSVFAGALKVLTPGGDTPMAPAVSGALSALAKRADLTRKAVLVLVTDGVPTSCGAGDPVASIVADLEMARGTVPAYIISAFSAGRDATLGGLAIAKFAAAAGTTPIALPVDDTLADKLTTALDGIRGAELPCAYDIPAPRQGAIEYGKVNVRYRGAGGSQDVLYVGKATACDPVRGGWYYDVDPAAGTPHRVLACQATCRTFAADPTGQVDLLFGCKTRVIE
jgi:hypothetical protein